MGLKNGCAINLGQLPSFVNFLLGSRCGKKGIEIPSVITVIALAVLFLLVVASFGIPIVKGGLEQLKDFIGKVGGGLFGRERNQLESAIVCSYLRCKEGCNIKLKELKFVVNGKLTNCFDTCSNVPDVFKPNNKICDWDSSQYPVEISIDTEASVSKSKLNGVTCLCESVVPSVDIIQALNPVRAIIRAITILKNFLIGHSKEIVWIDPEIIVNKENRDEGDLCMLPGPVCYNLISVKPSHLYILTSEKLPSAYSTLVWGYKSYITMEPNVISIKTDFEDSYNYRLVIDDKDHVFSVDIRCESMEQRGFDGDCYCEPKAVVKFDGKELFGFGLDESSRTFCYPSLQNPVFRFNLIELNPNLQTPITVPNCNLDNLNPMLSGTATFRIDRVIEGEPCILQREPCRYFLDRESCESNDCKWCEKCSRSKINKFRDNMCIEKTDDCGYSCSIKCGASCEKDEDCLGGKVCLDCKCVEELPPSPPPLE